MLKDKTIVIGVTGGIAAYKSCDIVSRLKKLHANVHVIMTKSATEFVNPLTFQSLSQNKTIVNMFDKIESWDIEHISLAKTADLFLIAPATANIIAKISHGIADDMLSTTIMATRAPILIAPAMNTYMYQNCITQENLQKLRSLGYNFVNPESGRLACGDIGSGKLASPEMIVQKAAHLLTSTQDFSNKNILITAGPTREAIDPVRFITNHSTGKMGYALAKAAIQRGANVTLISGSVCLDTPYGLHKFISVESAQDMLTAVINNFDENDIVIKSAAVADYRPVNISSEKIKKADGDLSIKLQRTTDILQTLGQIKKQQILVGFAAETNDLIKNATKKIQRKNLDLIVANDITAEGAGFGCDTNVIKIIDCFNNIQSYPKQTKDVLSHNILNQILKIKAQK